MAQLIQPFDATKVDPSQGMGQLPIGQHPVIIESSEVKPNKNNDGGYLQLNLRVTDGQHAGASGAWRLNLYHSNPQTVEIAGKQLSGVCHAVGVFQVSDSSQLHNIPFIVEVGPQKNDPKYTEVQKVFDRNGNEPGKQGAQQTQQPQQQTPAQQMQQPAQQPAQQWGQPPTQQAQQPQNAPAWGQPQQTQQPANAQQNAPAWGQPAQQQQAPAQQQPAQSGGWQQGGNAGGAAPWGQR